MSNLVKKVIVLVLCTTVFLLFISTQTTFANWIEDDYDYCEWDPSVHDSGNDYEVNSWSWAYLGEKYCYAATDADASANKSVSYQKGAEGNASAWTQIEYTWDYGSCPETYYYYKVDYEGTIGFSGEAFATGTWRTASGEVQSQVSATAYGPEGYQSDLITGRCVADPYGTSMEVDSSINGLLGVYSTVEWENFFEDEGYIEPGFNACYLTASANSTIGAWVIFDLNTGAYADAWVSGSGYIEADIMNFDLEW
jgi:hypothetical protein